MGKTSKELLQLEHKNPSTSSLESSLLVCKPDSLLDPQSKRTKSDEKPTTTAVPQSQVLGKVKDFLGVISEANKRLQLDAKDNSENYDIEALTGDESQVIEMDLMLGVADLHTPEAVAAAESAISGRQPVIQLADSSSETESDLEDSSDDDDEESDGDDKVEVEVEERDSKTSPKKLERSKSAKEDSSSDVGNSKSKKRPKIVELL